MFVQVIQGRVADQEGLNKQFDLWDQNLKSQAEGFLGSTSGITEDGQFIAIARFESEEAAGRNSGKPEQDQWWSETQRYFADEPTFQNCTEIDEFLAGGSDDAGFVQIIQGRTDQEDRVRNLDRRSDDLMSDHRPDLIGGFTAWHGDGGFTTAAYFTSEAEARAGEQKERPAEVQQWFDEWNSLMGDVRFFDLKEPRLISP